MLEMIRPRLAVYSSSDKAPLARSGEALKFWLPLLSMPSFISTTSSPVPPAGRQVGRGTALAAAQAHFAQHDNPHDERDGE